MSESDDDMLGMGFMYDEAAAKVRSLEEGAIAHVFCLQSSRVYKFKDISVPLSYLEGEPGAVQVVRTRSNMSFLPSHLAACAALLLVLFLTLACVAVRPLCLARRVGGCTVRCVQRGTTRQALLLHESSTIVVL